MRYILLMLLLLFFTACTPKYKTLYSYKEPKTPQTQMCVKSCKEKLATCRALCKSNFEICTKEAEKIGKRNYEKKLQNYYKALEEYTRRVEMYNLERELFWYDDFYYYRRGYGVYSPFGARLILGPSPSYSIPKPVKPTLQQEIMNAQLKHCRIDCKCLSAYDDCFKSCGGEVIEKKICIENCPK